MRSPARGRMDSFLPATWTWDRKNAATFLSRLPAREARRARTKRARRLSTSRRRAAISQPDETARTRTATRAFFIFFLLTVRSDVPGRPHGLVDEAVGFL